MQNAVDLAMMDWGGHGLAGKWAGLVGGWAEWLPVCLLQRGGAVACVQLAVQHASDRPPPRTACHPPLLRWNCPLPAGQGVIRTDRGLTAHPHRLPLTAPQVACRLPKTLAGQGVIRTVGVEIDRLESELKKMVPGALLAVGWGEVGRLSNMLWSSVIRRLVQGAYVQPGEKVVFLQPLLWPLSRHAAPCPPSVVPTLQA